MIIYNDVKLEKLEDVYENGFILINETELNINNKVKQLLSKHKLTARDLAKLTGTSRQTISTIINRYSTPSLEFALKCSHLFDSAVNEIFELTDNSWVKPLKTKDDLSVYYDWLKEEIISSKEKGRRKKDLDYMYIDTKTKKLFTKAEGQRMINRSDNENIRHIYQRVGKILKPYKLK